MKIVILDQCIREVILNSGVSIQEAIELALRLYKKHPTGTIYIQLSGGQSFFVDPHTGLLKYPKKSDPQNRNDSRGEIS
jgi:hypothetical protein